MYVRSNLDLDKAAIARVIETKIDEFADFTDDCLGAIGAAPTPSALDEPAHVADRMRGASLAARSALERRAIESAIDVGNRIGKAVLGRPAAFDDREERRLAEAVFEGVSRAADAAATMFDGYAKRRSAGPPVFHEAAIATFDVSSEAVAKLRLLKAGDKVPTVNALVKEAAAREATVEEAFQTDALEAFSNATADVMGHPPGAEVRSPMAPSACLGGLKGTTALVSVSRCLAPVVPIGHPLVDADLLLSALWEKYSAHKVDQREWRNDERISSRGTLQLVLAIVGDKRAADYTPQDLKKVQQTIRRLPAKYAQAHPWRAIYETQGPLAIVEMSDDKTIKRVSDRTWNNHYSSISGCFAYATTPQGAALPNDWVNPCKGLFIKTKAKKLTPQQKNEKRRIFAEEEIRLIFTSRKFMGAASASRWKINGPLVVRDHRYWLVIIGFLHGNRREEPVLLQVKHVKQCPESGIWYFDLEDPKLFDFLKDSGSARLIPLHRMLLELGFLEARVFGRDPNERLFPDAESQAEIERDAGPFGQWFLHFRRHLGIVDPAADWHAARTTVINLLRQAGVGPCVIEALVGHEGDERKTELETYARPMRLQILKSSIDMLEMPIDIALLRAAVEASNAVDRLAAWPNLKAPLKWKKIGAGKLLL